MLYTELTTTTNFTFLTGASHPHEYVEQAYALGYQSIAITDECSLAGIVKAYVKAKELNIKLIVGSRFIINSPTLNKDDKNTTNKTITLTVLAPNRQAYRELSGFISLTRRRSPKGQYQAKLEDLRFRLKHCLIIWQSDYTFDYKNEAAKNNIEKIAEELKKSFPNRLWIGITHQLTAHEQSRFHHWQEIEKTYGIPLVATGNVVMHEKNRKPLQDTLTAIRHNTSVDKLGTRLLSNAEGYLKPLDNIAQLYPARLIDETQVISDLCNFSMEELRYQYPEELVPSNTTPIQYLRSLVSEGEKKRWPQGTPDFAKEIIEKELALIEELHYEYYFLTVFDIVNFARSQNILCQGRGSAANSVVCYCLHITEIAPGQINVLFERFISKERDEPPDIDVDFEHQRREEVIQYIYQKYTRERAALAATVVTYRSRSAIRDVGKALGLDADLIDHLAKSLAWWDRTGDLMKRIEEAGLEKNHSKLRHFFALVESIIGFPRHLSQHVGGFIITHEKVSDLVPVENASMEDRTVIQWDKEDIEAMGLLKVDVLALGMLTALRKSLHYVHQYEPSIKTISDIPKEDPETYAMLSRGDSIGVFQVESRAQMSMLPRLKPKTFYDLVIEIAIVRPGPIQGDMVHPYLRRRDGLEPVTYHNDIVRQALEPTLGIPIFQEQVIRLAMVAAGFSGGEADQLRRAMASWGKNGNLLVFEKRFTKGMLKNGYSLEYAERLFSQIKGFGGYGFPESHSASFALLCYFSSWLKCHHPAAFFCALLNSQPMGFYSPSQLIQDARRHNVKVTPVDVNYSDIECTLEKIPGTTGKKAEDFAIRLGFNRVKSLPEDIAQQLIHARNNIPFTSIHDLQQRSQLSQADIQLLAAADTLHAISGNRYQAHWQASAIKPSTSLELETTTTHADDQLSTEAPSLENNIVQDYATTRISLRPHPMVLLRSTYPFNKCTPQNQLEKIGNGRFVRIAGLVTGRQRPGTAKGTLFLTIEDETGNMNVIVWKATQTRFRKILLTSRLMLIKGRLETQHGVIHIIAGALEDYSETLDALELRSRDFR